MKSNIMKILVLGSKRVGKTAITVRFLTKRYIGEYKSNTDLLYQKAIKTEDGITNVEILDVSRELQEENENFEIKEPIEWAEAFVIIYSICDRHSFSLADEYLKSIARIRAPVYVPIILIANKRDLEVGRQVNLKEGRTLALKFGCQFFEISAADSNCGVSQAFEWLLHQTHKLLRSYSESTHSSRTHHNHRKLSIVTVSRVFSAFSHVFGKSHSHGDDNNNYNENNNGNTGINGHKNTSSNGYSAKRKIASVMIPVVRKTTKPTISL